MSSSIKKYKILINSQNFNYSGNMKGTNLSEIVKKVTKITLNSLKSNSAKFIITETKTGKNHYYSAFREDLVRPYYKNGKLIKHRLVVKKNSNNLSGGQNTTEFTKYLNLLFEHNVQAFITYVMSHNTNRLGRAKDLFLLRHGLFENPSMVALRIGFIYRQIDWKNPHQDRRRFLTWITGTFIPLLNKIKLLVPTISEDVDRELERVCDKNLETIIQNLTNFCDNGVIPSD
jgi:hypothetical protein